MEKTTVKTRAKKSNIKALRSEQWLTQLEASEYLGISLENFKSYLNDGFFLPGRSLEGGEPLIYLDSLDEFLKTGTRARPSEAQHLKQQKAQTELREVGEGVKRNIVAKINEIKNLLPKLESALEMGRVDQIVNQSNVNAGYQELETLKKKLGL